MELLNKNLKEYSDMVNSDLPAPGGGSVAAYVSTLGVALARMMGHLSINKKVFLELDDNIKKEYINTFNKLEEYYQKLILLVEEDTIVFNKVMDAYKMAKDTEQEKEIRSKEIQKATLEATISPMKAAMLAYEALELTPLLIENGNRHAISDLASSMYLLEAGMNCSILNVKINANSLKDISKRDEFLNKCEVIQKKACQIVANNIKIIDKLL